MRKNRYSRFFAPCGDFSWVLKPSTTEKIEVTFFVINNNGIEKEITIKLDVIDNAFDNNIITQSTILTSNESNIEIELTGSATHTYSISYNIIPADGSTIFESGVLLPQNTAITLGSTFLKFNFKEADNYEIEFIIQNSLGTDNIKSTFITVGATPFTLNIVNNNDVIVNENLAFDLSLSGSSDLVYTLSYSIISGEGSISIADNTVLAQGSTAFNFTPSVSGTTSIEFVVTDNYGISETITKNIAVKNSKHIITSISPALKYQSGHFSWSSSLPENCIGSNVSNGSYTCEYFITLRPFTSSSATTVQKFRYRLGSVVSQEYDYVIRSNSVLVIFYLYLLVN